MARKLELRSVDLDGHPLPYGEMMLAVLRHAPPQRGVTLDEIVDAVAAMAPIQAADAAGADHVVLEEKQWATLRDKLAGFPFRVAAPEFAEFGLHIRDAPEIGLGDK